MKHIINYLGSLLAVLLIGSTFTACTDDDDNGSADVGLGIKVFFPTKVVANQPMTINGSDFDGVTEVLFPGVNTPVTAIEHVSNEMIRVNAPAGIAAEGGKIIVRTAAGEQAESRLPLTVGHTKVSGFSKQPGESAMGGELITVFGTDLEFITGIELLDTAGVSMVIDHKDFYRKGTSSVIFRVPDPNIYTGSFVGKIHTYDGQKFDMPELAYEPAPTGHWEIVKTSIWKNDTDLGVVNWGTVNYRIAGEGFQTGEEVTTIPTDLWEKMKFQPFYISYTAGDSYQIRVTTGWWSEQWLGKENDIAPWNMAERIIDNGNGTFCILVDFSEDPTILSVIDQQHMLLTGAGYTPLELYFEEEVWVENGEAKPSDYDIAAWTVYQNEGGNTEPTLQWPYYPSWSNDAGKIRIMRGMGDPAIETLGLTTSSKFVVYKEVGTTGQIQWNNPNWGSFAGVNCSDWDGSAETIEVPVTEEMLQCINGEVQDGWSNTAMILQGDGLTVTKIVLVP